MFNRMGLHAAVVHYRVKPDLHPAPLMDAARAVRIVRHRARKWRVDPRRVAICGFSAGGHLAGSLGVHFGSAPRGVNDAVSRRSCRPDAMVLSYAVISYTVPIDRGCFRNLLGDRPSRMMTDMMSLERHVGRRTQPAFVWSTVEDQTVPIENSLMFTAALRKWGIPYEFHAFPRGRHGLGLSPDDSHVASWARLCAGFFRTIGILD
jgi:acetyl esterase/lipase